MDTEEEVRNISKRDCVMPRFVSALLDGSTIEEASAAVGVSKTTGYRWAKTPEFIAALDEAQSALCAALHRRVFHRSASMVDVLESIAKNEAGDERARVQAAKSVLDFTYKFRVADLERKLEAQIASLDQRLAEQERLRQEDDGNGH